MLLVRARRVRSPPAPPEWPRSSAPQTAAPASATSDGWPARTAPFPFRFLPAAGTSNPSPPPSGFAGSLPGSRHVPPRSAEIHNAWSILHAAAEFPAVIPAAAPLVAPAASNAPGPPAFAENHTLLRSARIRLLQQIHTAAAATTVSLHPPPWSSAGRPDTKPPASSNP